MVNGGKVNHTGELSLHPHLLSYPLHLTGGDNPQFLWLHLFIYEGEQPRQEIVKGRSSYWYVVKFYRHSIWYVLG